MLGGFTTFSSFSLDVFRLIDAGRFPAAGAYVMASVFLVASGLLDRVGDRGARRGMSGVQTLVVAPEDGDQRLDRWFRRQFPHVQQGPHREDVPEGRNPRRRRAG